MKKEKENVFNGHRKCHIVGTVLIQAPILIKL
jgi:hypothetical protein